MLWPERAVVLMDGQLAFGQIVAANCMSDVWAMGGEVLTCLNLLGYPPKKMDTDMAAELLKGCADKIQEANAVLCGGHTWMDPEVRVGLAVTGVIDHFSDVPTAVLPTTNELIPAHVDTGELTNYKLGGRLTFVLSEEKESLK